MTPTGRYVSAFVDSFPTPMEPGVLYVSSTYSSAGHLCPCGCGGEIVTRLSPARYSVVFDGEVSLRPSVAAVGLSCNSHYFITRGQVDWHASLGRHEESTARKADQRAVEELRSASARGLLARAWRHLRDR
jgi:hypothetical protein